jgi:hypothetical protein
MANFNLGRLTFSNPIDRNDRLERSGNGLRTNTYVFNTGSVNSNAAISTQSFDGENIALVLFKDNNNSGVIDPGDTVAPGGNAGSGGIFQSINVNVPQGSYIARLTSAFDTNYNIKMRRTSINTANPLTSPEIPLGQISADLQRQNRVSDTDTADNFVFSLDDKSSLNLNVRELGNKKDDVTIRVVQDLNGNGSVEENEVMAMGASNSGGNIDTITGLKGAGNYILQVCQRQGSTRFEVDFDHSVA